MSAIPYFEIHIRPMFRVIDRDHMSFRIDLWNYEEVKELAPRIAELLRLEPPGTMPTKDSGGPWPEGWIQVFELWIAKGCPRLSLTQGQYTAQRIGNGRIIFDCIVQLQNGAEDAWVEPKPSSPGHAEYVLYLRPAPPGVQEPPRSAQFQEVLSADIERLTVHDIAGAHEILVTS